MIEYEEDMPKIIHIGKDDKKKYELLKKEEFFIETKNSDDHIQNKDLFLLAAVYGFKYRSMDREKDFKADPSGFVRTSYLKPKDWALIKAIAVHSKGIDILKDKKEMIKLIEKYAHMGIDILYQEVTKSKHDTFHYEIEKKLRDIVENE